MVLKLPGVKNPLFKVSKDADLGMDVNTDVTFTKEFMLYPVDPVPTAERGNYTVTILGDGETCNFSFIVPQDFNVLQEAVIIVIPVATANESYDLKASVAKTGELYDADERTDAGLSTAVTDKTFSEYDASSVLTNLEESDHVGIELMSQNGGTWLRVYGMRVKYQ